MLKISRMFYLFLFLFLAISCGKVKVFEANDKDVLPTPTGSVIDLGALVTSSITKTSFNAEVAFTDDTDADASVNLYYCNSTVDSNCDPLTDGTFATMSRESGIFTSSISGLTTPNYYPGENLNLSAEPIDPDGLATESSSSITLLITSSDETIWNEFQNRDGSYILGTSAQLTSLSNDCTALGSSCSSNFILGSNIDMSGINFKTIGGFSSSATYSGTFDGNNKTISNLEIISPSSQYVALFSILTGTIKDLDFDNVNM